MIRGKTFISTRPAGRSEELREFFSEQGAELLEMPMIDIRRAELTDNEKEVLRRAGSFDWIVFTSSNGVIHFFGHLKDLTGSYETGRDTKIAVIGRDTGSGLSRFAHEAHYTGKGSTGEAFSAELRELFTGKNPGVLLPAGNLARGTVEEGLKGIAEVFRINVYNTEMPRNINYEVLKFVQDDKYEMIIFTSSSGFNNFCLAAKDRISLDSLRIACIGSVTAETVMQRGIKPLVTAQKMNSSGIAEAIMNYYR
ncbi:MAG: uroporphyrinogen-III synthase [Bacteroidales bacterium]